LLCQKRICGEKFAAPNLVLQIFRRKNLKSYFYEFITL
jgi:hypothetical protein